MLLERLATKSAQEWFEHPVAPPASRAGRSTTCARGVELAERLGLEPVVLAGDIPTVRNPMRLLGDPGALRPGAAGAGRARRRDPSWLAGEGR